ncbi:MAG TPA: thioredoxin, partial [Planctomycetaceae bacterium]|nr:thioredoxin [Planctomycetaceae bacterium]
PADKPADTPADKPAKKTGATAPPATTDHAKAKATPEKQRTNRLSGETSPYLLLHAHNPVDWFPWGPEALEKARKEGKMIFLSIGYSSCYWCHVMERESFSDPEIARFMNEHFVNIKIDREERPDIDDIYMTALGIYVTQTGGGTGWPLSMFLTPDTRPVAGGTYFPPRDQPNRPPGFLGVLKAMHKLWTEDKKSAEDNATVLTKALRQSLRRRLVLASAELDTELVGASVASLINSHDTRHGGIGFNRSRADRPKFPTPPKLELLAHIARLEKDSKDEDKPATAVLDHTLLAIANGGIHDQVGGGFHRYSTDRRWHVPHFEKMLYDNAQLAGLYVDAFARTGQPAFRAVAEGVFTYVLRDMTDPDGPFFSAQDAETDAIEGKYYVWSGDEIDMLLGADAKLFRRLFGVVDEPEFEHGNVLYRAVPLEQSIVDTGQTARVAQMHQKLLATRIKRKPPLLDDKVLTSWNGLMIRSLADGGRVLKKPEYTRAATRAAEFLIAKLRDNSKGHLLRTYRQGQSKLHAYLVDYAFLAEGLLALHQATGDEKWLTEARKLTDEQISLYWDKTRHGFYFTSHNHEELLARTQNGFDSVLPSGNSTSVRNLVRLAKRTGDAKYRTYAQQTLEAFAPQMREHQQRGGMGMSHMALALAEFLAK